MEAGRRALETQFLNEVKTLKNADLSKREKINEESFTRTLKSETAWLDENKNLPLSHCRLILK